MAIGVIDRLETVQIQKKYRHRLMVAMGVANPLLEAIHDQGAIGQDGQFIMMHLVAQQLFKFQTP